MRCDTGFLHDRLVVGAGIFMAGKVSPTLGAKEITAPTSKREVVVLGQAAINPPPHSDH